MNTLALTLIGHLVGDYLLQTHEMSQRKTTESAIALLHAILYSIPFVGIIYWMEISTEKGLAIWSIVTFTHYLIDRYRLATWYIYTINRVKCPKEETVGGYPPDTPPWLAIFLVIIIDNTFHIVINATAFLAFA